MTTAGQQARPKKRRGICIEPETDGLVCYEWIRAHPVDSRAAGYSERDDEALNRRDEPYAHSELNFVQLAVKGYTDRQRQSGEAVDPRVIDELSADA